MANAPCLPGPLFLGHFRHPPACGSIGGAGRPRGRSPDTGQVYGGKAEENQNVRYGRHIPAPGGILQVCFSYRNEHVAPGSVANGVRQMGAPTASSGWGVDNGAQELRDCFLVVGSRPAGVGFPVQPDDPLFKPLLAWQIVGLLTPKRSAIAVFDSPLAEASPICARRTRLCRADATDRCAQPSRSPSLSVRARSGGRPIRAMIRSVHRRIINEASAFVKLFVGHHARSPKLQVLPGHRTTSY